MMPNKKRKLHRYQQKIVALILAHIKVSVRHNQAFEVGCKTEEFRNQVCQSGLFHSLVGAAPRGCPNL